MIIGNGLLSKGLQKIDNFDTVFFASGVSNSKTTDTNEFKREKKLLEQIISKYQKQKIVYFSTYSLLDPSVAEFPYLKHKLNLENFIKENASTFLIVRTGNIVGKQGNPKTILNYIFNSIKNEKKIDVWKNAYRNLLDIEHLVIMLDYIIKNDNNHNTVYLVNPLDYNILSIVEACEVFLGQKGKYTILNRGEKFSFDKELSNFLFKTLSIKTEGYLKMLLTKYY